MVSTTKDKKQASATTMKNGLTFFLKSLIACFPLIPAIKINLDSVAGQGETWAYVAIGFVICGALFIENSLTLLREKRILNAGLWGILGIGFVTLNIMNALGNAATYSDHSRDQKRAQIQAAAIILSQRSQLSQRRDEVAKVAEEATPKSLEADIDARKSQEAQRWRLSEGCKIEAVKGEAMRTFCKEVADLEKKKAMAIKRDEIDAQLAKLDEKVGDVAEVPSTTDSFEDSMAEGLESLGFHVNDKARITTARNWGKAIGVEIMAGFGPGAILYFLAYTWRNNSNKEGVLQIGKVIEAKLQSSKVNSKNVTFVEQTAVGAPPIKPLLATIDDPIHSFIARRLERYEGTIMMAGDLWKLWQEDCSQNDLEPGTQQAFGRRMKQWFSHERNNGRPRYLNVRAKMEHTGLRLAVSNF